MRSGLFFLIFVGPLFVRLFQLQAHAAPSGPLVKHLSSLVKWSRSAASKSTSPTDVNVLQFEEGYLVETVVEGNELGVVPYSIRVSQDGELYAVDAVNSNIVRITPPLSHYSRARLVAGSFQGHTGHVDGKPTDARFNHPKGVTMDDKGNVYVADTTNLAIRKIGEAGVTTIAGGKSNVAGYRDGPSEDAKFSSDFDVIYVRPTCSLLVIDRGNAALRQISLNKGDCEYENSSVSSTDLLMVAGAVLIGYVSCMLQQGFGSTLLSKVQADDGPKHEKQSSKEIPTPVDAPLQDEQEAGWPSFGQLVSDLCKFSLESLASIATQFIPFKAGKSSSRGLTPLKDSLIMPEDEARPTSAQKHRAPPPISETRQTPALTPMERFAEVKPTKTRTSTLKDPSLSTKHRSSKRQEYAEFYSSGEVPPQYAQQVRSKSQKDRTKHRHREKSGESTFGSSAVEPKPAEVKPTTYESSKYDPYNFRNKYGGDTYRYE